jgi:hypothetical protein
LWYWGLNSCPTPWATPSVLLCEGFFRNRVLQTIWLGWIRTVILLISASWVAKVTVMRHQHQAYLLFLFCFNGNQFILLLLGWDMGLKIPLILPWSLPWQSPFWS